MKFVYPEFLWSLFALAIPVIIHLFNFRKYKTLYFSSLTFIKHVDQQTRSTQKLKHLLILALRLLALLFLILAFAQPFIPVEKEGSSGGNPVLAIYIDNSFSMTAKGTEGELISEAREMARKMINDATLETRILLSTNKMNGIEQRLITKIEALELLDKIEPIALTRKLDDVLNWQRAFIDKQHSTNQKIGVRQYVFFSDFQQSSARFSTIKEDKTSFYYPVLLTPQKKSNCYIDSVWFSSPIQKIGQNNELNVRVVNSSNEELTNIELHCEVTGIKRDVFLDLPKNNSITTVINYTETSSGYKSGKISLSDDQLFWDDDYFFSYFVDNGTSVLVVNGENKTSAVPLVYSLEKYYKLRTIEQNSCTLDDFKQVDLVVINGANDLPSGLAHQLEEFAQSGGSIALFPGKNCQTASWNVLLSSLRLPLLGEVSTAGTKIDKLIYDDPFFTGMFEKRKEGLNMPAIKKIYRPITQGKSAFYELIRLQNGMPLFLRSEGDLNAFLFTSSLDADFGTFTSNALFPSILLRIGEMSQRKTPISLTIGKEAFFPLYKKQDNESPIHLKNNAIDFIPKIQQRGLINYVSLSGQEALELLDAGTYNLIDEKKEGVISLNYDRAESIMTVYAKNEIIDQLKEQGIKNVSFSEINSGQSITKIDIDKPFEYWKLFILFCLLFILAELFVLKRWK